MIDEALARHAGVRGDALASAQALGWRELAAIFGAGQAARLHGILVLLDGFVCTAAAAPLAVAAAGGLGHTRIAHVSAEARHRGLVAAIGQTALLDLGMRLGEASGAALAIRIVRAALGLLSGVMR